MNKKQSVLSVKNLLLVAVAACLLIFAGWYVYRSHEAANNAKKDGLYFMNKYKDPKDKEACLAEYYAAYPQSRPENHQPNVIYLAPPCPGVPQ